MLYLWCCRFIFTPHLRPSSFIPDWIRDYPRTDFRFDLVAGLTVGVMLIPQGMAYALIAGLPPIYGLYASTLPAIVYAWFGTSRQLSVGPGALTALLTAASIGLIAQTGTSEYFLLVTLLVLIVGLIQFMLGWLRLGFLVHFLSHPVILGFTTAAVMIIGLSQCKHLLGIPMSQTQHVQEIIKALAYGIQKTHLPTLAMGGAGLILLVLFQRLFPRIPGALAVVALSILVTWIWRFDLQGISIVGQIPQGLPRLHFTGMNVGHFLTLFPTAFAIALISFMESTAVARTIQARHKSYKVIPNRELMAIGLANIASGLLRATPVTGGMSRSMVNDQAGARSGMASIVSALLILLTLILLTPVFYYLPHAILAAVILVAVVKLIRLDDMRRLWMLDRKDFWMMAATFAGTLFLGISAGIIIGVLLSLAWIIFEASYPHHAELGRVPGTHSFRNVRRFSNLDIPEGVLIFRYDAPLFFANINRFDEALHEYMSKRTDAIRTVILDMESISSIDSSALDVLDDMLDELAKKNVRVLVTEVKGPVRDKLYSSGLTGKLGAGHFFVTNEDALRFLQGDLDTSGSGFALQTNANPTEG